MAAFRHHLFVCLHGRPPGARESCGPKGSGDLLKAMKARVRELGLEQTVRVNKSGCLDQCAGGPHMVVYPEGVWYAGVRRVEDALEIVDRHLARGEVVERLRAPEPGDDQPR
jgi:(2Fe-2S) ferredoxin